MTFFEARNITYFLTQNVKVKQIREREREKESVKKKTLSILNKKVKNKPVIRTCISSYYILYTLYTHCYTFLRLYLQLLL